ncbi:MAG TPA: thioesterase family protein [Amycolatopsis sp.]|nr:thioesterase family protein [Amycolatopsis sp.]
MDVFGHVNHAKLVTLLEEARVPLLFEEAGRAGLELAKGMVVVKLAVHYRAPIVVHGQQLRVEISQRELKAAALTLDYRVHTGPSSDDKPAVVAETVLAPYEVATERPRRFTTEEREFLGRMLAGGDD